MFLRQVFKVLCQFIFFPAVYFLFCLFPKERGLVIFADAHSCSMPSPLKRLYAVLEKDSRIHLMTFFCDSHRAPQIKMLKFCLTFLRNFAVADAVVICNYFLPASIPYHRRDTFVLQLWHASGACKKFGLDADDDLPRFYPGNPLAGCDAVTVSSQACVRPFSSAFGIPQDRVLPVGTSVTDFYFDRNFIQATRNNFYTAYPKYASKKIVLWAPTFRGPAVHPDIQIGLEALLTLKSKLPSDYILLIRLHPHLGSELNSEAARLPVERLLPVVDLLIGDYSSIIFDFALLGRPMLFFMPDRTEYLKRRGLYLDPEELPGPIVTDGNLLVDTICNAEHTFDHQKLNRFREKYLSACDGHSTERIASLLRRHVRTTCANNKNS